MAHLEVVFDRDKEIAAIVNMDERRSWGPAMIGEVAGEMLAEWVAAMPFDVAILDERIATQLFQEWLSEMVREATQEPTSPPESPMGPTDGGGMADATAAEHEARDAGSAPPEPQPADTDMAADESTPATVIVCPLCEGRKVVTAGEDEAEQPCGMCRGIGMVTMGGAT